MKEIHIEDYALVEAELPIFAMLNLYLKGSEDSGKEAAEALKSREGMVELLEKAAAYSISQTADFKGDRGPVNNLFNNLDCREVVELSGERIKKFLEDSNGI